MEPKTNAMTPIHKFNGGAGATICHACHAIISTGHTDALLCRHCQSIQRALDRNWGRAPSLYPKWAYALLPDADTRTGCGSTATPEENP